MAIQIRPSAHKKRIPAVALLRRISADINPDHQLGEVFSALVRRGANRH